MSEFPQTISAAELDRLVDGELSLAEQRAALVRLECEPDGWRRLALAFLESQTLQQVCPGLLCDGPGPAGSQSASVVVRAAARSTWVHGRILGTILSAAAILLAFALGLWTGQPRGDRSLAANAGSPVQPSDSRRPTFAPVDRLQVMFPEGAGRWSDPVELPVVDGADRRAQVWLTDESVWPASLRDALRAAGRRVTEQRQWMPVDLEDGRQGFVPVSELVVSTDNPWEYP
jgi:hypothetical protein